MPRYICGSSSEFFSWMNVFGSADRYIIVKTYEDELIADPVKSTKPLRYLYYKGTDIEECSRELEKRGYQILTQKRYEWDTEKAPGIRVPSIDDDF